MIYLGVDEVSLDKRVRKLAGCGCSANSASLTNVKLDLRASCHGAAHSASATSESTHEEAWRTLGQSGSVPRSVGWSSRFCSVYEMALAVIRLKLATARIPRQAGAVSTLCCIQTMDEQDFRD